MSLFGRAVLVLACLLACGACRRGPHPRITKDTVERCERGLALASRAPSMQEGLAVSYSACADVYVETTCRNAFLAASKLAFEEQLPFIFTECRKAYCPLLKSEKLDACQDGFVMSPLSILTWWPPFHDAVIRYDGRGYAPRLSKDLLMFAVAIRNMPHTSASQKPPSSRPGLIPAPGPPPGQ